MLKNEISINNEKIISLVLVLTIDERLLTGRKPPDEIKLIDKLKELNVLNSKILSIKNIPNVNDIYKIKIFDACFNVSDLSNEKKLVKDFLRFSSKISINKIIENKKYNPPIHWDEDLHIIKLSSICLILSKIVNPVEVNPEIDSK